MIFKDQLHRTIELKSYPKRIISLVPSQSELLWDLELRDELVGITKFCIHPKALFDTVEKVGGTKTITIDKIRILKPDLIIGNKEENEQSQIQELQREFNVWMSDIYTLNDALGTINAIGELVNKKEKAYQISKDIEASFSQLKTVRKSVLYLIWKKPYMASGKATFIGNLIHKIGLDNVIQDTFSRYPSLTIEEIKKLNPELLLLSSEPYPFKEKDIRELQIELPNTNILLVDGELFSWYGSRLLKSVNYFNQLIAKLS